MSRRLWMAITLTLAVCGEVAAGVFIGASSTSFPTGIIAHPKGYSGSSTTSIVNTVCFNPATLPSGVTEAQVDNTIAKAIATWNGQRYGTDNYLVGGNNDLSGSQYDFESALLHELGHCIGLGHPTIAVGTSGSTADATASRPDAGNSYDLDNGADDIYGSRDDLRGDNTNLYWFYTTDNNPLAYPAIIDTTTFSQATGSLPVGSTWPANANSNVTALLLNSSTRASMTWNLAFDEVRRRLTAEDLSTIKLGRAGRDGVAGNSDDYSVQLTYDSSVSSCDITVSFTTATSFGQCSVNMSGLTSSHYVISSPTITFNPTPSWYFSQSTNTTTTITSDSPDPSVVNNAYSVGVSVVRSALLTGTPTGSVLISDGSASCTATLSGSGTTATGSCSLTSTTTGAKTLTATYLGYQGFDSSSDTEAHTVNLPSATINVTDSPDPTAIGVSYNVAVSLSGSFGTPTGSVTVSDGSATCGPITLVSGAGNCNITSTTGGTKTITASYGGNASYAASTGSTSHTVNYTASTLSLTDTPDPTTPGGSITIGATVSGAGGTPTGTVTIDLSDGGGCSITLSGGTGSCVRSSSTLGTLTISGAYDGNSVYSGSTATISHSVKYASTTTISSDTPDPSVVGQAYTVAFSVANTTQPATTPTGSVTVSDGSASCSGSLSSGTGSCSLTSTTQGSKSLTATYAGDSNVAGSTSATAAHTVNAAATTTTISADTPDPSVVGQAVAVTFAVAATSPGSGTPSGTVTISAAGGSETCSATLPTTSCNITLNASGARALTATFVSSNTNFSGSTSSAAAHTVNAASTTTTISADTPDPSVVGQAVAVTFSVAATSPGSGSPSGTVTISAAGGSETCTATLPTTSCNVTLTTSGSRALTATFVSSNSNFSGSSSSSAAHTVNAASTTTTISADTPDPSVVGQAVTVSFTVAVTSPGSGTPTGAVTVSAAGGSETCTAVLPASSCAITLNAAGARALSAAFVGSNANFNNSTSSTVAHTVNAASTTTVISSDLPDPSVIEQAVSVNVAVAAATPGGGIPEGTVTVTAAGGAETCTATLPSSSCDIVLTAAGARALTASFVSSSGNYSNSASAAVTHTVDRIVPVIAITSDAPDPSVVGEAYTVAVTLTGTTLYGASGAPTPTGSVSISDGSTNCTATLSNGAGSCALTGSAPGTTTVTAQYLGDPRYASVSDTEEHTVMAPTPTLSIVSHAPDPSDLLQDYVVQVSLVGSLGTPTGSVLVRDGGTGDDGTVTCSITLANGGGACTLASVIGGTRTLAAEYSGDSNYEETLVSTSHSVNRGTATMVVSSHVPDPSAVGQDYFVRVDLSRPSGADAVFGTVTISDGSTNCSGQVFNGTGGCTLSSQTPGELTLTASYSGSNTYLPTTASATHTVLRHATTTNIVSDEPDPSPLGGSYSVSVEVLAAVVADGSVSVSDGINTCTATLIAGAGSCSLPATREGSLTLTASYAQTATHASSSTSTTHTVIVSDRLFANGFQ